ncbi:hypothetical protein DDZ14_14740 [Maritimibacter sp. 55A14]|uniref:DUF1194 domain-containing protein n=1 Tax=Maritimibacter sp. 55A14 TaxID=2174844 RepID=UPI000D61CBCF|nr:DUF1194 domain-containing protein [Maritimibacter sp. 55A14]PWE30682.1 hypothetical protein DDZ14_14740 [Maritimibacter sp. 55A14]
MVPLRALCLAAALALPLPARAGCDLALVLALDVSSSVDAREYALQRDGLAAALNAPDVRNALLGTPGRWVSLAAFEWSGRYKQSTVLDWTALRSEADLARVTVRLAAAQRSETEFPTALGYGLGYAAGLLARAPDCARKVVDVSGDGINNDGFGPHLAYAHFPFEGVTVNALVIEDGSAPLSAYFRREVLRGPGAFLEPATGYGAFERAMTRKLLREIGSLIVGAAGPGARDGG